MFEYSLFLPVILFLKKAAYAQLYQKKRKRYLRSHGTILGIYADILNILIMHDFNIKNLPKLNRQLFWMI